jgi:hypothetical protein
MGFEKGHQKFGGRLKGVPNHSTKELKAFLGAFLSEELATLPETFNSIKSPEKRLELIVKFLPFILPRVQDSNLENLPDSKLNAILEILTDESARQVETN